eukprot:scaffold1877_cov67-Phaeocystis_antarctica.AAC.7
MRSRPAVAPQRRAPWHKPVAVLKHDAGRWRQVLAHILVSKYEGGGGGEADAVSDERVAARGSEFGEVGLVREVLKLSHRRVGDAELTEQLWKVKGRVIFRASGHKHVISCPADCAVGAGAGEGPDQRRDSADQMLEKIA